MTNLVKIKEEINLQIGDKETFKSLVDTTFKGVPQEQVKRALMEGMMRGFTFEDFLQKNVYAIPFGSGYTLITSIDYCRKVGMRSGVIGNSEPSYEMEDGKIISCSVTIKRKVGDDVGEYTSKVYFSEFDKKKSQWTSMPKVMIAKVAEMHALRKACPEELSKAYVEEERTTIKADYEIIPEAIEVEEAVKQIEATESLDELRTLYLSTPFTKFIGVKAVVEAKAKKQEIFDKENIKIAKKEIEDENS